MTQFHKCGSGTRGNTCVLRSGHGGPCCWPLGADWKAAPESPDYRRVLREMQEKYLEARMKELENLCDNTDLARYARANNDGPYVTYEEYATALMISQQELDEARRIARYWADEAERLACAVSRLANGLVTPFHKTLPWENQAPTPTADEAFHTK